MDDFGNGSTNALLELSDFDLSNSFDLNLCDLPGISSFNKDAVNSFEKEKSKLIGSDKRQSHCEIEKRRRDKLNLYILQLSKMLPNSSNCRKKNKLAILKQAVKHIRSLKAEKQFTDFTLLGSIVRNKTFLLQLLLNIADSFLLILNCNNGEIHHVSETVKDVLGYSNKDLTYQNFFSLLHPKDVLKVKEQLSSTNIQFLLEFLIEKGNLQKHEYNSHLWPGLRREFFCRLKSKTVTESFSSESKRNKLKNEKTVIETSNHYLVVHCVGYILNGDQTINSASNSFFEKNKREKDKAFNMLIIVCKPIDNSEKYQRINFITKMSIDGKINFVDNRVALVLDYLPQELIGSSYFDMCRKKNLNFIFNYFRNVLDNKKKSNDCIEYSLLKKSGKLVRLRTNMRVMLNPFNQNLEFLIGFTGPALKMDTNYSLKKRCRFKEHSIKRFLIGQSYPMERISKPNQSLPFYVNTEDLHFPCSLKNGQRKIYNTLPIKALQNTKNMETESLTSKTSFSSSENDSLSSSTNKTSSNSFEINTKMMNIEKEHINIEKQIELITNNLKEVEKDFNPKNFNNYFNVSTESHSNHQKTNGVENFNCESEESTIAFFMSILSPEENQDNQMNIDNN